MADRTLIDRPAVARRLGITVECFYRRLVELYADGFPKPAIGRMTGARWDPVAIDRWLDGKIKTPKAPAAPANGQDNSDEWAAKLDGRVALVAAGVRE
jgi:predicted DNA-binding transcriptional regulator AlpA